MKQFSLILLFPLLFIQSLWSQAINCSNLRSPGADNPPGCLLCKKSLSGSNDQFTRTDIPVDFPCGDLENNAFLSIPADSLGEIRMHILLRDCFIGMEGIFYDQDFKVVSDCFLLKPGGITEVWSADTLNPHERYIFMFDGIGGDVCHYDIILRTDPDFFFPPFTGISDTIALPEVDLQMLCIGKELDFSTRKVPEAEFYDWVYPDFLIPVSEKGLDKIRLKPLRASGLNETLTVVPFKGCAAGQAAPKVPVRALLTPFNSDFIRVCEGRMPVEINGFTFHFLGQSFSETLQGADGCDSIVTYRLTPDNRGFRSVDTAFCIGDSFDFENRTFTQPGTYEFLGMSSNPYLCDSMITLNLTRTGVTPPKIDCIQDSFLNILSFRWEEVPLADGYMLNVNGEELDVENPFFIHHPKQPGERVDISVQPYNSRGCSYASGNFTCFAFGNSSGVWNNNPDSKIQIFPNPSTGVFQIQSFSKIKKTAVFDFSGRKLLEVRENEIDLSNFHVGVYWFKIFFKNRVLVRKVFKK